MLLVSKTNVYICKELSINSGTYRDRYHSIIEWYSALNVSKCSAILFPCTSLSIAFIIKLYVVCFFVGDSLFYIIIIEQHKFNALADKNSKVAVKDSYIE